MKEKISIPPIMDKLKTAILKAIEPILPIDDITLIKDDLRFSAERTNAGRSLPEYYLCYFLLVDLLGFKNLGMIEKVAWSVPIDYNGVIYFIEHRKMGLGVFAQNAAIHEDNAKEIVKKISRAVKLARPYFEWKAVETAKQNRLNVKNYHYILFERFECFLNKYKETATEAKERAEEIIETKFSSGTELSFPGIELKQNAEWLALATLEAFFSWTEHVFIHLAILNGKAKTGKDVADLADSEWSDKFKKAIEIESNGTKKFYDELIIIRRQFRNYITHGAFGKNGEAFTFHSEVGAVPLLLTYKKNGNRFTFYHDNLGFNEEKIIGFIEKFIVHLWSNEREPARVYLESGLPLMLPCVTDGTYLSAMKSVDDMKTLVDGLCWQHDQAANMDW